MTSDTLPQTAPAFQAGNTGSNPVGDTSSCSKAKELEGRQESAEVGKGRPSSPPPHHGGGAESLAQLVEHRPFKPRVGGSNPPRLTFEAGDPQSGGPRPTPRPLSQCHHEDCAAPATETVREVGDFLPFPFCAPHADLWSEDRKVERLPVGDSCRHPEIVEHKRYDDGSIEGLCSACGEIGFPIRLADDEEPDQPAPCSTCAVWLPLSVRMGLPDTLQAYVEKTDKFVREIQADQESLRARLAAVEDENLPILCAHCSFTLPAPVERQVLLDHIATCPGHPMRAVEHERDQLRARLATSEDDVARLTEELVKEREIAATLAGGSEFLRTQLAAETGTREQLQREGAEFANQRDDYRAQVGDLRAQLAQAQAEREEALSVAARRGICMTLSGAPKTIVELVEGLVHDLRNATAAKEDALEAYCRIYADRDQAKAEAAAMRSVVADAIGTNEVSTRAGVRFLPDWLEKSARAALSTTAGAELLRERERYRTALESIQRGLDDERPEAEDFIAEIPGIIDAALNPGVKP